MKVLDLYVNEAGVIVDDAMPNRQIPQIPIFSEDLTYDGRSMIDLRMANNGMVLTDAANFVLGTGDFCVEATIFYTHKQINHVSGVLLDTRYTAKYGYGIYLNYSGKGNSFTCFDLTDLKLTTDFINQSAHHFAVSRNSGTIRAFVNGIKISEYTDTGAFISDKFYIGQNYVGEQKCYHVGLLNLKVFKGESVYTSNFSPPIFIKTLPPIFRGNGVISGFTKIKGAIAPNCRVLLFSHLYDNLIGETTSSLTGNFIFQNISKSHQFWIKIIPPDHTWEHLIVSRIIPA